MKLITLAQFRHPLEILLDPELNFLYPDDTEKERILCVSLVRELSTLLGKPFHSEEFDFCDHQYFNEIYKLSERLAKDERAEKFKACPGKSSWAVM